jgi:uncharacterized protein (TIGR00297 family)
MSDIASFLVFSLALLGVVGTGEGLRAFAGWRPEASRRVVHALTGLLVATTPLLFHGPLWIYLLAAAFVVVNGVSVARGWLPGMHGIRRRSIGTVTFPLALIFALFTCWTLDPGRAYVLQIAFVVLALADPLASLVGTSLRRPGRIFVGPNEKSYAGSAAFFLATLVATTGGLYVFGAPNWTVSEILLAAVVVACLATGAEALATSGWDNLAIVVAVVTSLVWLDRAPELLGPVAFALAVSAAFMGASYGVRFLTLDGALAASGLAFFVLAFGGWAWAVPAFTFFILSSLLSKLGRRRKASAEVLAEKGSTRDAGQVYANGGVGWLLLLAYVFFPGADVLYWGFAGAFAAAAADTWATEVGTLVRGKTRSIWSWRPVPPGTSGGVSIAGTLAALAGATVVFASLAPFATPYLGALGWAHAAALVIGAGFLASLVDSMLGATAQALYRDANTGLLTERAMAGVHAQVARGWRWLTNDRVNMACTLAGALVPLLAFMIG